MQLDTLNLNFSAPFQHQSSVDGGPISMRRYQCSEGRVRVSDHNKHVLLINEGEPLSVTCVREHQPQSTFVADKHSLIGLLPAGTEGEVKWYQPLKLRVLTIDSDYIQRLTGTPLDLRPQWNMSDSLSCDAFRRLNSVMSVPHFPERTYADSLLVLGFDLILRSHKSISSDLPGKGKLSPAQLHHVVTFAYDSMQHDIGLLDLANLVHLSAYHFGRLFKQTVSLSPYQYLLQLRIEFAKRLILEKSGPLGEIAYQLNFSDQAHFSNAFRKATGFSPRQYQHRQAAII